VRRIDRLLGRSAERSTLDLGTYQDWYTSGMSRFPFHGTTTWPTEKAEPIGNDFAAYVNGAYKSNGIVFSVMLARRMLFTEATFQWRNPRGELFGTDALRLIEEPWVNGTTADLLARMEQDDSLAGNCYVARYRANGRDWLARLRPDWVDIMVDAPDGDLDAVEAYVSGYRYRPGGKLENARIILPEFVAHYCPNPDPLFRFRGMSWLTPILREIQADGQATRHKSKFFENAATPNVAVSLKETISPESFAKFKEQFRERYAGTDNAYETMLLNGADMTVVGADMKQLDFKATQGAGETRICAAGGVPPIIVGLSEGLQASTYSNYGQARRKFGDHWARPSWRDAAAALGSILPKPAGAKLWYDTKDIAFLQEDEADAAEIHAQNAQTIKTYVEAGFTPDSAVLAVNTGNATLLEHTGLVSVQLQPPGTQPGTPAA
jgi:phage portal protein BeeE